MLGIKNERLFLNENVIAIFKDPDTCKGLAGAPRSSILNGKPFVIDANKWVTLGVRHMALHLGSSENEIFAISFFPEAGKEYVVQIKKKDANNSYGYVSIFFYFSW